mmetsp:Transcript_16406/g.50753  ORF Transcript_16406/g.50753 Transcript_16406/m.50753 type:complete len:213 (+) Transcript_16406:610-1248(+)
MSSGVASVSSASTRNGSRFLNAAFFAVSRATCSAPVPSFCVLYFSVTGLVSCFFALARAVLSFSRSAKKSSTTSLSFAASRRAASSAFSRRFFSAASRSAFFSFSMRSFVACASPSLAAWSPASYCLFSGSSAMAFRHVACAVAYRVRPCSACARRISALGQSGLSLTASSASLNALEMWPIARYVPLRFEYSTELFGSSAMASEYAATAPG